MCNGEIVSYLTDVNFESDCLDACNDTAGCQWYSFIGSRVKNTLILYRVLKMS